MDYRTAEKWLAGERFVLLFILFAAPFIALWAFDYSLPFSDEETVYTTICHGVRKDGDCRGKEEPLDKTTYKALADQQIVIFWGDNTSPSRLEGCAVRNTRNWSCPQDLGYTSEMIDGQYKLQTASSIYQVPKWYWWWLKFRQQKF